MSKYKFVKCQDVTNPYDTTKVILAIDTASLPDLLEAFQDFLKASGFNIDGTLDIVKDEI